jgi:hypothetical protein
MTYGYTDKKIIFQKTRCASMKDKKVDKKYHRCDQCDKKFPTER